MGKLGREIGREVAAAFKEHRAARREAWHPQGPPTSTQPPRATTFWGSPYPQTTARRAWEQGYTTCSGTGCGWGRIGPCGCQAQGEPKYVWARDILASLWRAAWHPQGPPTSTQPPRATTFWGSPYPQTTARRAWEQGYTTCSGTGCGWGRIGPCGCQV